MAAPLPPGPSGWSEDHPRTYVCGFAPAPPALDGPLDAGVWASAPWTDDFQDIEGARRPAPRFRTRAKMLWDDRFFYVAADLEEPHLRADITRRNEVIFYDNDFEVFLDPDGDNHAYHEFEVNARNTVWELRLPKPYMDGGVPVNPCNLPRLRSAVRLDGTLNDPADTDRGWTVAVAFPWDDLAACRGGRRGTPAEGEVWRVNFSRVEWTFELVDGRYHTPPRETRPEDNWVWSPQGRVDMHRPDLWGAVQFTRRDPRTAAFSGDLAWPERRRLLEVYDRQRRFREARGDWASRLEELGLDPAVAALRRTAVGYEAAAGAWRIREDSKVWKTGSK